MALVSADRRVRCRSGLVWRPGRAPATSLRVHVKSRAAARAARPRCLPDAVRLMADFNQALTFPDEAAVARVRLE
jgi:L-alanine-DL-glutamate epimerase-like enolase superfamily enzyme